MWFGSVEVGKDMISKCYSLSKAKRLEHINIKSPRRKWKNNKYSTVDIFKDKSSESMLLLYPP